jgi:hypothetical protein
LKAQAVAENQPANKNRMTSDLSIFAARLHDFIAICADDFSSDHHSLPGYREHADAEFSGMALMLFTLQFQNNSAYRKICEARKITPASVHHWTEIPAVPTSAFKELELSCLPANERTHVFHSSGTTAQKPSRHFHNAESLALYEASLWPWFEESVLGDLKSEISKFELAILTPPSNQSPNSSLVHMFEIVRQKLNARENCFLGTVLGDGSWSLNFTAALDALNTRTPRLILGTAFSFVHLLDFLAEKNLHLQLPPGSRVMETGGYKNRSRALPKAELHTLISECLGIPRERIICEYGMSELSSQAYQTHHSSHATHHFHFPPWSRAQVISPETGKPVADGETGLLRIFDLANAFSVMAVQTEDLAIRRGDGFELLGRAETAEPRGCSLMSTDS